MDDTRAAPITDDLYAVLGVECDADDARIEHAFRVLAHRLHPDTRPPDADTEPVDPEVFRRILAAYAVLRDPLARRRYDNRHGPTHLADPGTAADPAGTAEGFAQLALELHEADGVEGTIRAVVDFALKVLACDYAGVALHTVDGSDEPSPVADPSVLSQRRPDWTQEVGGLGVRSVLEVPLRTRAGAVGVLCLYSTEPEAFGPPEEAIAHILARHASIALASAQREHDLWEQADGRKLVGQAVGILMERNSLDADQALSVINRYAQETNAEPGDVARKLIDSSKPPARPCPHP